MTPMRYPEDYDLEPSDRPTTDVPLTLMEVMCLQDMTRNSQTYDGWYVGGPLNDKLAEAKRSLQYQHHLQRRPALAAELASILSGAFAVAEASPPGD